MVLYIMVIVVWYCTLWYYCVVLHITYTLWYGLVHYNIEYHSIVYYNILSLIKHVRVYDDRV